MARGASPTRMTVLIKRYANRKLYNTADQPLHHAQGHRRADRSGRRSARDRQRDRRGHHLRRAVADPGRQRARPTGASRAPLLSDLIQRGGDVLYGALQAQRRRRVRGLRRAAAQHEEAAAPREHAASRRPRLDLARRRPISITSCRARSSASSRCSTCRAAPTSRRSNSNLDRVLEELGAAPRTRTRSRRAAERPAAEDSSFDVGRALAAQRQTDAAFANARVHHRLDLRRAAPRSCARPGSRRRRRRGRGAAVAIGAPNADRPLRRQRHEAERPERREGRRHRARTEARTRAAASPLEEDGMRLLGADDRHRHQRRAESRAPCARRRRGRSAAAGSARGRPWPRPSRPPETRSPSDRCAAGARRSRGTRARRRCRASQGCANGSVTSQSATRKRGARRSGLVRSSACAIISPSHGSSPEWFATNRHGPSARQVFDSRDRDAPPAVVEEIEPGSRAARALRRPCRTRRHRPERSRMPHGREAPAQGFVERHPVDAVGVASGGKRSRSRSRSASSASRSTGALPGGAPSVAVLLAHAPPLAILPQPARRHERDPRLARRVGRLAERGPAALAVGHPGPAQVVVERGRRIAGCRTRGEVAHAIEERRRQRQRSCVPARRSSVESGSGSGATTLKTPGCASSTACSNASRQSSSCTNCSSGS